jgi:iron(III) transport system ATP-binding protein
MHAALQVEALSKAFAGRPVLRHVSLAVPPGGLVAILGASGSGKTTLLRLICGFEQPDSGCIRIGETVVADRGLNVRPERRGIGYVAQEGALFPHLTVAQNVLFGLPRRERGDVRRAGAMLEQVGLPSAYAARQPQALSGGEQQRVALARALAPGPLLVLLDEPFSALDAALRADTRDAVVAALAAAGTPALLVTHDQAEALSTGHQVAVLRDGAIVQMDTPEAVYRRPADAALAQFVGDAVLLRGEARRGMVETCLGRLALAPEVTDGSVQVLVRPEQIRVSATDHQDGAPARVRDVAFHGHDARLLLELEAAGGPPITARVFGHLIPAPGSAVWLSVTGEVVAYSA